MKSIYLTVVAACAAEFLCTFLPLKEDGALKKYVRYIISLAIILSLISPITSLFKGGLEFPEINKSHVNYELEYIYVENSGVYASDEAGNKASEESVLCDMYIKDACMNIVEGIENELYGKFGIKGDRASVAVAFDTRNVEEIKLICVHIDAESLPEIVKEDMRAFVGAQTECEVRVE